MKFLFLLASFVGAHVDVGFQDARPKRTSLRRGLKKYKDAKEDTTTNGDSYFSYYYGDGGDFSYASGGATDAGSNDSTFLERICDLYAEFETVSTNPANNSCQNFERFEFLMCPKEYTVQRICSTSIGFNANLSVAIMNEYCFRFFPENLNSSNGIVCPDLCKTFVVEADCCNVRCP